jgi:DNA-binding MarR family transcriptional regulator
MPGAAYAGGVYPGPAGASAGLEKALVSRAESPDDRRVRIVALTKAGKDLIVPIFRKHSAEIGKVFADASPKELQILETVLKKAGKRAKALAEERSKRD